MQFTEADRKFIRKLAKAVSDLQKDFGELQGKLRTVATPTIAGVPERPHEEDLELNVPTGIQLIFKAGQRNELKQKVLMESIYRTLSDLCQKNQIESLSVRIENHPGI